MTKICLSCNNTNNIYKIHKKSVKDSSDWLKLKRDVKYFKTNNITNISLTRKEIEEIFQYNYQKSLLIDMYIIMQPIQKMHMNYLFLIQIKHIINLKTVVVKLEKMVQRHILNVLKIIWKMDYGIHIFTLLFQIITKNGNLIYIHRLYYVILQNNLLNMQLNQIILILNALPMNEYIKDFIPMSMPLPYNSINDVDDVDITNYIKKLSVHSSNIHKYVLKNKDNIYNIPLIVYCYDSNCNASNILIRRLWNIGFKNIKEYSGGIKEWKK